MLTALDVQMGCLLSGDWHRCLFESIVPLLGEPLFGLLLGGSVLLAMYLAGNGSLATPAVLTVLFAFVLVPVLPGGMRGAAWTIAFLGVVAALVSAAGKYVLAPGVR